MLCEAMLQNIIKGMAAIGSNTCRRMAPAAAENAKPENPLTKPPRKTAVESIASSTGACIRVPRDGRELAVDAGRQPDFSSTRPLRCGGECVHEALPPRRAAARQALRACAIANQGPAPAIRACP